MTENAVPLETFVYLLVKQIHLESYKLYLLVGQPMQEVLSVGRLDIIISHEASLLYNVATLMHAAPACAESTVPSGWDHG